MLAVRSASATFVCSVSTRTRRSRERGARCVRRKSLVRLGKNRVHVTSMACERGSPPFAARRPTETRASHVVSFLCGFPSLTQKHWPSHRSNRTRRDWPLKQKNSSRPTRPRSSTVRFHVCSTRHPNEKSLDLRPELLLTCSLYFAIFPTFSSICHACLGNSHFTREQKSTLISSTICVRFTRRRETRRATIASTRTIRARTMATRPRPPPRRRPHCRRCRLRSSPVVL
jgi:hypothetical protein